MAYLRQSTATRNLILGLLIVSSLIVSFIGINRIFADEGVTDPSDEETVKKEFTGRDGEHKANLLEGIKAKIQAALESGGITQEEADEKLEKLENLPQKGFGRGHKKPHMNPEDIKAKIQAAVEGGAHVFCKSFAVCQGAGCGRYRYQKLARLAAPGQCPRWRRSAAPRRGPSSVMGVAKFGHNPPLGYVAKAGNFEYFQCFHYFE